MAKKVVVLGYCIAIVCIVFSSVWSGNAEAQEAASNQQVILDWRHLAFLIIESVIFSVVGFIILMVGYKVFDIVTPFSLNKEIAEDDNTAAGIALAGVLIALGLIVAAAISG